MLSHVFVYGSLLPGQQNHALLAPFIRCSAPAFLTGMAMVWASDTYPGILRGSGTVTGELVELDPDRLPDALAALDELEDYRGPGDPANEYERAVAAVSTRDGGTRPAWVYLWNGEAQSARPIPGGDWRSAVL